MQLVHQDAVGVELRPALRTRRDLAVQVLTRRGKRGLEAALDKWLQDRSDRVARFIAMLDEMKLRSEIDFAPLSVAAAELRVHEGHQARGPFRSHRPPRLGRCMRLVFLEAGQERDCS